MKFRWQDFVVLALILFFLISMFITTRNFKSLPSPIYGGDYYYQLGCINHIKYGGNPLSNCQHQGGVPGYFPMYSIITGMISKLGFSAMDSELLFSYFIIIGSILTVYFLTSKIFNKDLGLIAVFMFENVSKFPIWKYTDFTSVLIIPLFFLALYLFYKNKSLKNSILLGLMSGISIISHSTTLFPIAITLSFFSLLYLYQNRNIRAIFYVTIILIITFVVGLLYWFKPIFLYHLQLSPHYVEWASVDLSSFLQQFKIALRLLKEMFFNFKTPIYSLRTVLLLFGGFFIFKTKNKSEETKFVLYLFIISLLSLFSYFITIPLLNLNFIPTYIYDVFVQIPLVLLACWSFDRLVYRRVKEKLKLFLLMFIFILFIITQIVAFTQTSKSAFYLNAKTPVPYFLESASGYIINNLDVNNDVILSNKYDSFALNALTGRKVMVSRRSQNDPFLNLDTRELDAAIILYGNDSAERTRLIKLYNITHLYWDGQWVNFEYSYDPVTQKTSIVDPLMSFYSEENEKRLKKYNISYSIQNTYVDPALRGDDFKKFDLLLIMGKYDNKGLPFDEDLISRLNIVWKYEYNGSIAAALFEVKK